MLQPITIEEPLPNNAYYRRVNADLPKQIDTETFQKRRRDRIRGPFLGFLKKGKEGIGLTAKSMNKFSLEGAEEGGSACGSHER